MEFKHGDVVKCSMFRDSIFVIKMLSATGDTAIIDEIESNNIQKITYLALTETLSFAARNEVKKDDSGKPRMDILFGVRGLDVVADVFTSGGKKYGDNYNWRKAIGPDCDKFKSRLLAAALRHLYKWSIGQRLDEQSGKSHLAHACANILMMLDLENQNNE